MMAIIDSSGRRGRTCPAAPKRPGIGRRSPSLRRRSRELRCLLLPALLLSCSTPPPIKHPNLGVEPPAQWTAGSIGGAPAKTLRWASFADSTAADLVAEALSRNYDLKAAAARLQAAAAQARIAGAELFPQVGAGANGSRRRQNFVGFPIPGFREEVLVTTTNNYGVSLNLSWEVDLWGRLRAGKAAAAADFRAAEADFRGAQLSLAAQTARTYLSAVEAGRQVELAQSTVDNYRLSSERIRERYDRGLRPSLDLRLTLSNLAVAEALLHQRRRRLDAMRRQLELLLGRYPAATVELSRELPPVPPLIPVGLPAGLVARRPDLAAAERRLAASASRLAASRAALYPRIGLTASGGRSSDELSELLKGDFSVWNLVGNLTLPLFQGGRLRAGVDLAKAGSEQALAIYASSVLKAYAEVESTLAAEGFLARQEEALQEAVRQAGAAGSLAQDRYDTGLTDLITVLESQRRAFEAESQLLAVRRQRLEARIDLHLALGGGFEPVDSSEPERRE